MARKSRLWGNLTRYVMEHDLKHWLLLCQVFGLQHICSLHGVSDFSFLPWKRRLAIGAAVMCSILTLWPENAHATNIEAQDACWTL